MAGATLLTVAYAAVLFLTALSDRLRNGRAHLFLLVLAAALFVGDPLPRVVPRDRVTPQPWRRRMTS